MKDAQKKIKSKTQKKLDVFLTSEYSKKYLDKAKEYAKDPVIKKAIKDFQNKYPEYFNEEGILSLPSDKLNNITKEWKTLLNEHKIGFVIKKDKKDKMDKSLLKPSPKPLFEIRVNPKDNTPYSYPLTKNVTANNMIDFIPFCMIFKNKLMGEVKAGRKPKIEDYRRWRAEFKNSPEKDRDALVDKMADREGVSPKTMSNIVRSKKND